MLPNRDILPLKELMLVPRFDIVETDSRDELPLATLTSEGWGEPAEDSFPVPFSNGPALMAAIPCLCKCVRLRCKGVCLLYGTLSVLPGPSEICAEVGDVGDSVLS